jgi:hypothetical protein
MVRMPLRGCVHCHPALQQRLEAASSRQSTHANASIGSSARAVHSTPIIQSPAMNRHPGEMYSARVRRSQCLMQRAMQPGQVSVTPFLHTPHTHKAHNIIYRHLVTAIPHDIAIDTESDACKCDSYGHTACVMRSRAVCANDALLQATAYQDSKSLG